MTANEARARAIVAREALIEHEVAHLTAALLLGRGATEIRIVDVPETDANGIVRLAPLGELTPERARVLGLIALVGGLATGEPYWPPRWPVVPYVPVEAPTSADERQLSLVVEYLLEGSAIAREAWRAVKSDSIGVSFGYLADEVETGDGTRLLTRIDLYEISLTATPMNAQRTQGGDLQEPAFLGRSCMGCKSRR